jgi:hypothetical protein
MQLWAVTKFPTGVGFRRLESGQPASNWLPCH